MLRPYQKISRRKTRVINVGSVLVGGNNPISVQTMTNTLTTDVESTSKQINRAVSAGVDLVRVSVPDKESTEALKEITKHSKVPIIADIHFHYKRAIEAANNGASCLRINPGNIGSKERVKEVIKAAKDNNCSIRVGVNAGSLDRKILEKYSEPNPEALVESARENIKILEDDKLMERVPILEPHFQKRLKMLEEIDIVGEARGVGLMGAVEVVHDKSPSKQFDPVGSAGPVIAECAHKNGLIVRAIGDTLAVCPPLIITEEQIDELFDKFSQSLIDGSEILKSR